MGSSKASAITQICIISALRFASHWDLLCLASIVMSRESTLDFGSVL
jgi:hypothetical protein